MNFKDDFLDSNSFTGNLRNWLDDKCNEVIFNGKPVNLSGNSLSSLWDKSRTFSAVRFPMAAEIEKQMYQTAIIIFNLNIVYVIHNKNNYFYY